MIRKSLHSFHKASISFFGCCALFVAFFASIANAQSPFAGSKQSLLLSNAQSGASERWVSIIFPSTATVNYRLILPNVAPTIGQVMNVASISGNDYTMQWADFSGNAWSLSGNAPTASWNGTTGSFLGTTNAQPLSIATTNATAQDIRFYTGASGASERMRILSTGNVGIGTSVPTARLHVNGTSRFSGGNVLVDTSAASTAGQLQLMNPARTFQTNLQAGAQTTNITYTLPTTAPTINGQVLSSTTAGVMSWSSPSTTSWDLAGNAPTASWNGTTGSFLGTTNAQPLSIATTNATAQDIRFYTGASGASERMRILSTGNVGIGTGSPSQLIHTMNGNILIDNNDNTARELRFDEPSSSGTNYTAFKAQPQASNITYTLPSTDGSSGSYLTTNGSGTLSWAAMGSTVFVRKTSDESLTNNSTLQDDDQLFFSIAANEVWEVDFMIRVEGGSGDIKFALSCPVGASMWVTAQGDADNSTDDYLEMTSPGTAYNFDVGGQWNITSTGTLVHLHGLVINSSTSGNIRLRWAQFSGNFTATTVKQHSYIRAARLQ